MDKIKVLHVIGFLGKGGDSTAIFNSMNFIEENKMNITYDFLTYERFDNDVYNRIKEKHKIFVFENHLGVLRPIKYYLKLKKILKENNYSAIHFHVSFQSCIGLIVAKKCKIPIRICHSHTTAVQRKTNFFINSVILPICRNIINKNATRKVACSKNAGKFLYGGNSNYEILYNGLNINHLRKIDSFNINLIKSKYNISDDTIVIGQVGRFDDNKNQIFTIELAKKINNKKFLFLLLGTGPTETDIKKMIDSERLDNVFLTGNVTNVNDYMSLFDFMVQPSKYGEGLPMTLIEQQVVNSNCICLASDIITKEADLGNVVYLSLNCVDDWVNIIKKNKCSYNKCDVEKFDILCTGNQWISLYK